MPERRSRLYTEFVDIWLSEAEQRGLKCELGERVCRVSKFSLGQIAWVMTEEAEQASETLLRQAAAAYLHKVLQISEEEAEVEGFKFVQVMARRSGVFTRRGDVYDFIHPTFREYLAAVALVRQWKKVSEKIWGEV